MKPLRSRALARRFRLFALLLALVPAFLPDAAWAGSESYSYDALGRLVSVTHANGSTETYTYDSAGNRVTASRSQ